MKEVCNCDHLPSGVTGLASEEMLENLEKFYSAFSTRSRLAIIDALDKAK